MVEGLVHNLGSEQIAEFAFGLYSIFFSFFNEFCDFFCPNSHYISHNLSDINMLCYFLLFFLEAVLDFADNWIN